MPSLASSKDLEDLINALKSNLCVWEDLISKSLKFHNSVKIMTQSSSDLLDCLHGVCDIASKSSCCLKNTGINLTKFVMREKKMEHKYSLLNNQINENLVIELEKCVTEWRKTAATLKREREHDWRKASNEYQRSLTEVDRTEKKLRKKNAGKVGLSETANLQIEYANQDALNKRRLVEELERSAMRRAAVEERQRFKQFMLLLKPILDCQLSLREDLDNLEEVVSHLYGEKAENLDEVPEELEQNIQEHTLDGKTLSMPRSYSTLSKQKSVASNGSHSSLNSNTMSTTSSEWNTNLISACMEVSRLNENMSNFSYDSGIKSDKSVTSPNEQNMNSEIIDNSEWDKTLSHDLNENSKVDFDNPIESDSEDSSTEDENDASTDHNSQDGLADHCNDVFPLPAEQSQDSTVDLPLDYQDLLPPPPCSGQPIDYLTLVTMPLSLPDMSEQQKNNIQHENLYPNQLIPSPVYSNLQELKANAAKKYGADTLSRKTFKKGLYDVSDNSKELSTSFLSNVSAASEIETAVAVDKDASKAICSTAATTKTDLNFTSVLNNSVDTRPNMSKIPHIGENPMKPSMIRRGSFATEMQLPQTPKNFNSVRKSSTQERTPLPQYSNKVRGRSMSVTRESSNDLDDDLESEDFNTIRERRYGQRIVNRINSELKPPTLAKPEAQKKQTPPTNYMSYDYSRNLSSPVAIRSSRFVGERGMRQSASSSAFNNNNNNNKQNYYQQSRMGSNFENDLESAAGEEPANNDFEVHAPEISHIFPDRKDDKFKQQLMQALKVSRSQDNPCQPIHPIQNQPPPPSTFLSYYNPNAINSNLTYGKSKAKASNIQNPKYCF